MFKLKIIVLAVLAFSCSNKRLIQEKSKDLSICKIESEKKDIIINKLYKEIKSLKENASNDKVLYEFNSKSQSEKIKICRNKVLHYKVLLHNLKVRNKSLKNLYQEENKNNYGC